MNISRMRISTVLFISTIIFLLPSCKHKASSSYSLRPLRSYIDYQETKQGITLQAKQLSRDDCKQLLGTRTGLLWKKRRRKKPIIPIQLSITNQTNNLVAIQPGDINLTLTDYNTIANRLHKNAFTQAFGELLAGIVITSALAAASAVALSTSGMLLVVIGSVKAFIPTALLGSSVLLVTPFFLVLGTPIVSSMKVAQTSKENRIIKQELKKHSLKHTLLVEPRQTMDTLIFVKKQNYEQTFTITVRDPKNAQNRIPFRVKLQNQF